MTRTNWRLVIVCGLIAAMAFLVGTLAGCGSSVEATDDPQYTPRIGCSPTQPCKRPDEGARVAPPVACGTADQPCPRVG